LRPEGEILSAIELQRGLAMPVGFYAMVENAMRAAEGRSLEEHADDVARLWASMSEVAARNPNAWSRDTVTSDEVRKTDGGNRMLAFPYTKRHNSQWNVDQAAGLILCSLETARSLGIPREKWVFPLAIAESNHMTSLTERRALHRCHAFVHTGRAVFDHVGCDVAAVPHRELYSCFPSAIRSQLRELGICDDRPVTVTGGMAFAGGPLNNFVLQGIARMIEVLRGDPGSRGLVTAVSGILTKAAVTLWSTEPAERGFALDDVSKATAADLETVEVVGEAQGQATIASYTVLFAGEAPLETVLACDLDEGRRALVSINDPDLAATAMREELCGRTVRLSGADRAKLD
jgi:acetyl-CoA C-acetyltransferase